MARHSEPEARRQHSTAQPRQKRSHTIRTVALAAMTSRTTRLRWLHASTRALNKCATSTPPSTTCFNDQRTHSPPTAREQWASERFCSFVSFFFRFLTAAETQPRPDSRSLAEPPSSGSFAGGPIVQAAAGFDAGEIGADVGE